MQRLVGALRVVQLALERCVRRAGYGTSTCAHMGGLTGAPVSQCELLCPAAAGPPPHGHACSPAGVHVGACVCAGAGLQDRPLHLQVARLARQALAHALQLRQLCLGTRPRGGAWAVARRLVARRMSCTLSSCRQAARPWPRVPRRAPSPRPRTCSCAVLRWPLMTAASRSTAAASFAARSSAASASDARSREADSPAARRAARSSFSSDAMRSAGASGCQA